MDSTSLEESVLEYHIFLDTIRPDPNNEFNSSSLDINSTKIQVSDLLSVSSMTKSFMGGGSQFNQSDLKNEMSIATLLLSLRASLHAYISPLSNTYSWHSQSFDLQLWDPVLQQKKRVLKYQQYSSSTSSIQSSDTKIDFNSTLNETKFIGEIQSQNQTHNKIHNKVLGKSTTRPNADDLADQLSAPRDDIPVNTTGVIQGTQSYADMIIGLRSDQQFTLSASNTNSTSTTDSGKCDENGNRIYTKEQLEFKSKIDSLYGDMFSTNSGEYCVAPHTSTTTGIHVSGMTAFTSNHKTKVKNNHSEMKNNTTTTPISTTASKTINTDNILNNPLYDAKVPQHFANIPHLFGKLYYDNNTEDVNFLFYLLLSLSQRFPDISIQLTEQKQSFYILDALHSQSTISTQAADSTTNVALLPKWLKNEDILQNRVWIRNGHVLIIPKGHFRHENAITTYYKAIITNNPENYKMLSDTSPAGKSNSMFSMKDGDNSLGTNCNNLDVDMSLSGGTTLMKTATIPRLLEHLPQSNQSTAQQSSEIQKKQQKQQQTLYQQAQWYLHHFIPSSLHPQLALYYIQQYTNLCYLSHFHTRLVTHKIRLYPYALSLNNIIIPLLVPLSIALVLTNGTLQRHSVPFSSHRTTSSSFPSLQHQLNYTTPFTALQYGSILLDLCYDSYKHTHTLYPTLSMKNQTPIFRLTSSFPKFLHNQSIYSDLSYITPSSSQTTTTTSIFSLNQSTTGNSFSDFNEKENVNNVNDHIAQNVAQNQQKQFDQQQHHQMPFVLLPFSFTQHRIAQLLALNEIPNDHYLQNIPPHIYMSLLQQQELQKQKHHHKMNLPSSSSSSSEINPLIPSSIHTPSKPFPTITTIPHTIEFNHYQAFNKLYHHHNDTPHNTSTSPSHPYISTSSRYCTTTISSLHHLIPDSSIDSTNSANISNIINDPTNNTAAPLSPLVSINDIHSDSFLLGYRVTHIFELIYQQAVFEFKLLHAKFNSKTNTITTKQQQLTPRAIIKPTTPAIPANNINTAPTDENNQITTTIVTTKSILYTNLGDLFPEQLTGTQIELMLAREYIRQRFSVNGHEFISKLLQKAKKESKQQSPSHDVPFSTPATQQGRKMFQHQHQIITLLHEFRNTLKKSQKQTISGTSSAHHPSSHSKMSYNSSHNDDDDDDNELDEKDGDLSHFGDMLDTLKTSKYQSLNDSPLLSFLPLPLPSYVSKLQAGNYTQVYANTILNYLYKTMRDCDNLSMPSVELFKLLLTTDPSPKHLKTMTLQRLFNPQDHHTGSNKHQSTKIPPHNTPLAESHNNDPNKIYSYSAKFPTIPTSKLYHAEQYMLNFLNFTSNNDDTFFHLSPLLSSQQKIQSDMYQNDPLNKSLFSTNTISQSSSLISSKNSTSASFTEAATMGPRSESPYLPTTSSSAFVQTLQNAQYSVLDDDEGMFNASYRHSDLYLWDPLSIATLIDEFTVDQSLVKSLNAQKPCSSPIQNSISMNNDDHVATTPFVLPIPYSVYSPLPQFIPYHINHIATTSTQFQPITTTTIRTATTEIPSTSTPHSTLSSISIEDASTPVKPKLKKKFGSLLSNPCSLSIPKTDPICQFSKVSTEKHASNSTPDKVASTTYKVSEKSNALPVSFDFSSFTQFFAIIPHSTPKWYNVQPMYGLDWYRYFILPKLLKSIKKTLPPALSTPTIKMSTLMTDITPTNQSPSILADFHKLTNNFLTRSQLDEKIFSSLFPINIREFYHILTAPTSLELITVPTSTPSVFSNTNLDSKLYTGLMAKKENKIDTSKVHPINKGTQTKTTTNTNSFEALEGYTITQHQECLLRLLTMIDSSNDDALINHLSTTSLPIFLKNPSSFFPSSISSSNLSLSSSSLSSASSQQIIKYVFNILLSHYNIHYSHYFDNTIVNYHRYIATLQDDAETKHIQSLFSPLTQQTKSATLSQPHTINPLYYQDGIQPNPEDEHLYPPIPITSQPVIKQTLLTTPSFLNTASILTPTTPCDPHFIVNDIETPFELPYTIDDVNVIDEGAQMMNQIKHFQSFVIKRDAIDTELDKIASTAFVEHTSGSQNNMDDSNTDESNKNVQHKDPPQHLSDDFAGASFWGQHNLGITQHISYESFTDINPDSKYTDEKQNKSKMSSENGAISSHIASIRDLLPQSGHDIQSNDTLNLSASQNTSYEQRSQHYASKSIAKKSIESSSDSLFGDEFFTDERFRVKKDQKFGNSTIDLNNLNWLKNRVQVDKNDTNGQDDITDSDDEVESILRSSKCGIGGGRLQKSFKSFNGCTHQDDFEDRDEDDCDEDDYEDDALMICGSNGNKIDVFSKYFEQRTQKMLRKSYKKGVDTASNFYHSSDDDDIDDDDDDETHIMNKLNDANTIHDEDDDDDENEENYDMNMMKSMMKQLQLDLKNNKIPNTPPRSGLTDTFKKSTIPKNLSSKFSIKAQAKTHQEIKSVQKKQKISSVGHQSTKSTSINIAGFDVESSSCIMNHNLRAPLFSPQQQHQQPSSPSTAISLPKSSRRVQFTADVVDYMDNLQHMQIDSHIVQTTSLECVDSDILSISIPTTSTSPQPGAPSLFHTNDSSLEQQQDKKEENQKRATTATKLANNVLSGYGSDHDHDVDGAEEPTENSPFLTERNLSSKSKNKHLLMLNDDDYDDDDDDDDDDDINNNDYISAVPKQRTNSSSNFSFPFSTLPDPIYYRPKKMKEKMYSNPFHQDDDSYNDMNEIKDTCISPSDSDNDNVSDFETDNKLTKNTIGADLRELLGFSDDGDGDNDANTRDNSTDLDINNNNHTQFNSFAQFQTDFSHLNSLSSQHDAQNSKNVSSNDESYNKMLFKLRGEQYRHQRELEIFFNDETDSVNAIKAQVNDLITQNTIVPSTPPTPPTPPTSPTSPTPLSSTNSPHNSLNLPCESPIDHYDVQSHPFSKNNNQFNTGVTIEIVDNDDQHELDYKRDQIDDANSSLPQPPSLLINTENPMQIRSTSQSLVISMADLFNEEISLTKYNPPDSLSPSSQLSSCVSNNQPQNHSLIDMIDTIYGDSEASNLGKRQYLDGHSHSVSHTPQSQQELQECLHFKNSSPHIPPSQLPGTSSISFGGKSVQFIPSTFSHTSASSNSLSSISSTFSQLNNSTTQSNHNTSVQAYQQTLADLFDFDTNEQNINDISASSNDTTSLLRQFDAISEEQIEQTFAQNPAINELASIFGQLEMLDESNQPLKKSTSFAKIKATAQPGLKNNKGKNNSKAKLAAQLNFDQE